MSSVMLNGVFVDLSRLVGLPEAEVITLIGRAGVPWRIVQKDGVPFVVTQDVKYDRINLKIGGGVVIDAFAG